MNDNELLNEFLIKKIEEYREFMKKISIESKEKFPEIPIGNNLDKFFMMISGLTLAILYKNINGNFKKEDFLMSQFSNIEESFNLVLPQMEN